MPNRPPKARTGIRYQICWPWVRWPLKTAARKSICFGVYGHGFPAGSPAGPHGESFLMHKSTTPELHAPDPAPTSIEDHVVALVIADRLGHSESSIRGFDHEPHLRYIPAMLAAFSATQHRALFCLSRCGLASLPPASRHLVPPEIPMVPLCRPPDSGHKKRRMAVEGPAPLFLPLFPEYQTGGGEWDISSNVRTPSE